MNLNLTLGEIKSIIQKHGYTVPRDMDGIFIGNEVRVRILHLKYSHVAVTRKSHDCFDVIPTFRRRLANETNQANSTK